MVNVAHFSKIKIEWSVKETGSTNAYHKIVAVSEFISENGLPQIPAQETLAQFPEDMKDRTQEAYDDLYSTLYNGKRAFDMTNYLVDRYKGL